MSDDKDGGKNGGWSPSINQLLLVLLAGTFLVSQNPYHDSRPGKPGESAPVAHAVAANPWQDPFEAVEKHVAKHEDPKTWSTVDALRENIAAKLKAVAAQSEKNEFLDIHVVAAMLPGSGSFEDGETRRRIRYAVLSGFSAALRYMPEDDGQLRFFVPDKADTLLAENSKVIYEWMVYKPTKREAPTEDERHYQRPPILVLWLNANDFAITPHAKLKALIKEFNGHSPQTGTISVLGPFNSSGLQDLVNEMYDPDRVKESDANYNYFSPSATVQNYDLSSLPEYIFPKNGLSLLRITATDDHLAEAINEELKLRGVEVSKDKRILIIGEWNSFYTWHLGNTFATFLLGLDTPPDSELRKKRTESCPDRKTGKLQEWDKQYDIEEQCVFRASYLRGLDGETPQVGNNGGKRSSAGKNTFGTSNDQEDNLEEASGDSQFDYVRRLAAQISELDQKINAGHNTHAISAIGILGSDVYDKLLISEALHSKFPDAIYFTNGMDARILEPKNNYWARNMIVASSFGLRLNDSLQKDIPPFRDSIQTAFFLATEMALAKKFNQKNEFYSSNYLFFDEEYKALLRPANQKALNRLLMPKDKRPAQVFEVGRTKPFDLSSNPCEPRKPCRTIHPVPDESSCDDWALLLTVVAVCLLLAVVRDARQFLGTRLGLWFALITTTITVAACFCAVWSDAPWRLLFQNPLGFQILTTLPVMMVYFGLMYQMIRWGNAPEPLTQNPSFIKDGGILAELSNKKFLGSVLLIVVSLVAIWYLLQMRSLSDRGEGEPFALLEGVSMWPSQAIRLVALVLASYYIVKVLQFPNVFQQWLNLNINLAPDNDKGKDKNNARSSQDPRDLLGTWIKWQEFRRRCWFILKWGIPFYVADTALLIFFKVPHIPFRGASVFILNGILIQGLLIPAAIVLLMLVTDAVMIAVRLVENCFPGDLNHLDDKAAIWPEEALRKYGGRFNLEQNPDAARAWVGMRFVVELTKHIYGLISYPLVVTLLMVVACSSYFDNWLIPLAYKLVIAFSLCWLLYWDHHLKAVADKARSNALKSLRVQAYFPPKTLQPEEGKALEGLISMIEDYDAMVYKSFTQRPIFLNSVMIMLALLGDSVDYTTLASKLFTG